MKENKHLFRIPVSIIICILVFISIVSLYPESPSIKRLTGVNWFGFETSSFVPHGLWSRDYVSMLKQIKDLGFNCIRIPWSNEMLDKYPTSITCNEYVTDAYTGAAGVNLDLQGLSSIEVLDKIVQRAGELGLRIILDCHSRDADGYYNETLWHTDSCPELKWVNDWKFVMNRYKNSPAVVAVDINNEPHGGLYGMGMKPPASWGYDVPGYGETDWKAAAERCAHEILQVDPDIIIIIQGVQESKDGSNYWWGSNHKDLLEYPVTSIPGRQLMFSVHEYGPSVASQLWFDDPSFPNNLEDVWRDRFWFIYEQDLAGLYIGEMGLHESEATDPSCIAYRWFTRWLSFAGSKVHWTYWCWNPNSGDTGGILKDDWVSVNYGKYNLIKPHLEPWDSNPTPSPYPNPTPGPTYPPSTPAPTSPSTPFPTSIPPPGAILEAHFSQHADGFSYTDDIFSTNIPNMAHGTYEQNGGYSGGGLRVYLGPGSTGGATSGGWQMDFYSGSPDITINLSYRMILGEGFEDNEYGEILLSIDGDTTVIEHMTGNGNGGGNDDTGWQSISLDIPAGIGNHTIIIGAYNNNSTYSDEWMEILVDDVVITGKDGPSSPVPTPVPTSPPAFTPVPTASPAYTPVPSPVPTSTPLFTPVPTITPAFTPAPTVTPGFTPVPTQVPTSTPGGGWWWR